MKKLYIIALMLLPLGGCVSLKQIPAGKEGVVVKQPWFFGSGGVEKTPLPSGSTWVASTTDVFEVDMQPIQHVEHIDDLMSSDGVPLDFDATARFQVVDSVKLYAKFGEKWYEKNLQSEVRNRIRQAVRKHGMNETAISSTAIDSIDAEVTGSLEKYIKEAGVPVVLLQFTVGKANPPDSIKNQRVETAAQEQRIITEQARTKSEHERENAERARAKADKAYREENGLNLEQHIRLAQIEMMKSACSSGHCIFTQNNTPVIIGAK